jgi:hypothetical protein
MWRNGGLQLPDQIIADRSEQRGVCFGPGPAGSKYSSIATGFAYFRE